MHGFLFSYRYRKVLQALGPLPKHFQSILDHIQQLPYITHPLNMVLVNEYEVGQGIMPHNDASSIFGPEVVSLSLLSNCVMTFSRIIDNDVMEEYDVLLRKSI
jgi:alkylated DNA repair dioxygenase AlkB